MVRFQSSHNHRGIFRRMPAYALANNPRGRVLGIQHKPFTAFFCTPCFKESWLFHAVRNARRGINGPIESLLVYLSAFSWRRAVSRPSEKATGCRGNARNFSGSEPLPRLGNAARIKGQMETQRCIQPGNRTRSMGISLREAIFPTACLPFRRSAKSL